MAKLVLSWGFASRAGKERGCWCLGRHGEAVGQMPDENMLEEGPQGRLLPISPAPSHWPQFVGGGVMVPRLLLPEP